MNFGEELGAMISIVRRDADNVRVGGVIVRDGEIEGVKQNGLYHERVHVKLETSGGEALEIEGDVKGFIPLRNRREGMVTHIGEGMTEWRIGDQVGYGLSEFLRQVE